MKRNKIIKTEENQPKAPLKYMDEKDLHDLQTEELSGESKEDETLAYSDTDEDEDEGLGDGKLGKSTPDILGK